MIAEVFFFSISSLGFLGFLVPFVEYIGNHIAKLGGGFSTNSFNRILPPWAFDNGKMHRTDVVGNGWALRDNGGNGFRFPWSKPEKITMVLYGKKGDDTTQFYIGIMINH